MQCAAHVLTHTSIDAAARNRPLVLPLHLERCAKHCKVSDQGVAQRLRPRCGEAVTITAPPEEEAQKDSYENCSGVTALRERSA